MGVFSRLRKEEESGADDKALLKEITLEKLNDLAKKDFNKKTVDEIYWILEIFFKNYFNVKKEASYTEFIGEIEKKRIDNQIKERVVSLINFFLDVKYKEKKCTAKDLRDIVKEAKNIINNRESELGDTEKKKGLELERLREQDLGKIKEKGRKAILLGGKRKKDIESSELREQEKERKAELLSEERKRALELEKLKETEKAKLLSKERKKALDLEKLKEKELIERRKARGARKAILFRILRAIGLVKRVEEKSAIRGKRGERAKAGEEAKKRKALQRQKAIGNGLMDKETEKKLINYIEKNLSNGHSFKTIRAIFIKCGYDKAHVDYLIETCKAKRKRIGRQVK